MKPKREYPFGRVQEDTVAQPLRNRKLAEMCKDMLERMTGDDCDVVPRPGGFYWLMRYSGERWIKV